MPYYPWSNRVIKKFHNLCFFSIFLFYILSFSSVAGDLEQTGQWGSSPYQDVVLSTDGNYAFVAASFQLEILDIRERQTPKLITRLPLEHYAWSIDLSPDGAYAYVLGNSVQFVDIRDVNNPKLTARLDLPTRFGDKDAVFAYESPFDALHASRDVKAWGGYAYVSTQDGLKVIDARKPEKPTIVATVEGDFYALALRENEGYALVNKGLVVLDMINPAIPRMVYQYEDRSQFQIYPTRTGSHFYDIAVAGDYIYAVDGKRLVIFDIQSPQSPAILGNFSKQDPYKIVAVAVKGNYAYLLREDMIIGFSVSPEPIENAQQDYYRHRKSYLNVLDVSDPRSPKQVAQVEIPKSTINLALFNRYLYVSAFDGGLDVLDIQSPSAPIRIGLFNESDLTSDIAISDSHIYLTNPANGLHILERRNGSVPRQVAEISQLNISQLKISDHYLVAVSNYQEPYSSTPFTPESFIRFFDISEATTPRVIHEIKLDSSFISIEINDHYLYVLHSTYPASLKKLLRIYDINNLSLPRLLSEQEWPSRANQFYVSSHQVYLPGNEILVVDVMNPSAQTLARKITLSENEIIDIKILGDHALCISDQLNGELWGRLLVFDLYSIEPSNVAATYFFPRETRLTSLNISGRYAYILGLKESRSEQRKQVIYMMDLLSPTQPKLVTEHIISQNYPIFDLKMAIDENLMFVSSPFLPLIILQYPHHERVMDWLESVYPKIFDPRELIITTIPPYQVRYYPASNTYLGYHSQNNGFYAYNPVLWGSDIIPLAVFPVLK